MIKPFDYPCLSTAFPLAAVALVSAGFVGEVRVQAAIACPERVQTLAVALADPSKTAGFKAIICVETAARTWLQDIAVYSGNGNAAVPVKGTPKG